nr:hypothetical protein B0A51_10307 [Rachicladosporium sp. CCFEE 5018]
MPPVRPNHPAPPNDLAARRGPAGSGTSTSNANVMDWETNAPVEDDLQHYYADMPSGESTPDLDSLVREPGTESIEREEAEVSFEDYYPVLPEFSAGYGMNCVSPDHLPWEWDYFSDIDPPPPATPFVQWAPAYLDDPELLDFYETRASADRLAIEAATPVARGRADTDLPAAVAVIGEGSVPVAHLDVFDAVADGARWDEDDPAALQHLYPGEDARFPPYPILVDSQPSIEESTQQAQEYQVTARDAIDAGEYELQHMDYSGLRSQASGPEHISDPMDVDETVSEEDTEPVRPVRQTDLTEKAKIRKQKMIDAQPGKDVACDGCPRRSDHLLRHVRKQHPPVSSEVPMAANGADGSQDMVNNGGSRSAQATSNPGTLVAKQDEALINQMMDEDIRSDRRKRDKRPAVTNEQSSGTVPEAGDAALPPASGVPRIQDVPIQPIDNDDDLGYRLHTDPRPMRFQHPGSGISSSQAANDDNSRSDDERDAEPNDEDEDDLYCD